MDFSNVYKDAARADAYARLEYPGTYFLAFRDIPSLLARHASGRRALDFGCGAGRSTRFLHSQGFEAIGVDISTAMVAKARERDPAGRYLTMKDGDFSALQEERFDVIFAAFTFDNIPDANWRAKLLQQLRQLLKPTGIVVLLDSTPDIYWNEWASFTTKDFPENRRGRSGDLVRIVMTDVGDRRPVEDLIWFDEDYRELFSTAGLDLVEAHRPLGKPGEQSWVSETTVAPWVIYVLRAVSSA